MGYIEDNLTSQEVVLYRGRLSRARFIFWVTINVALLFVLIGFITLPIVIVRYFTTEIAVTTRRVILKRGWLSRKVDEINTRSIENSRFSQGLFGRMFGYGMVRVEGMRNEYLSITGAQNPGALNKAVNESTDKLTTDQFLRDDRR